MALSYAVIYIIARKYNSTGVGYYSIANSTLLILGVIAAMGTNMSILRFVGKYNSEKERFKLPKLYATNIKIALPFSILIGAVSYFFASEASNLFSSSDQYAQAIQLIGITLPFFTINFINVEFIRGLKQLKISEFARSVSRPLTILAALIVYWNTAIPNIFIVYFFCFGELLNFSISTITVVIHIRRITPSPSNNDSPSYKELFGISFPMMITMITGTLMSTLSLFILQYYGSTEDVGIYSIAFRVSQLIAIVLLVVNTIAAPKFSELFWNKKHEELQRIMNQSVKIMFWGGLTLAVIIGLGSSFLLELFGSDFLSGQLALLILILGQLFNAATGSVSLFMNMSGHQNKLRNLVLITLGFQITASFIIIPQYGLLGAAIATTGGSIIRNLLCILYVKRKLNFKTYYLPKF